MSQSNTPKILYQTWKTKDLPPKFEKNREEWLSSLGPEWETPLLTDKDLRELVAKTTPQYLHAYDSFTENIERVDFARYVMMYIGGVYADLDTYPVKNIDNFVDMGKIVLGQEPYEHAKDIYGRKSVICNAFMISPPKQELWIKLMDYIVANYEPHYKPVYNTGPMAMSLFMDTPLGKSLNSDVVVTDPCVFFPLLGNGKISSRCNIDKDTYVVHEWENTWVTNPFKDPRWFNRRYWFYVLFLIYVFLFFIIWKFK